MNQVSKISSYVKSFCALLMLCFCQSIAWAQDKGADIDVNVKTDGGDWYTRPWVWIVAGAVFLLLLVALLRGGNRRD